MIDLQETYKTQLEQLNKNAIIINKALSDATKKETEYQTKMNMCMQNLEKYGITPQNATEKVSQLEAELTAKISALGDKMPQELLDAIKNS